jgi:hypothetical protein
MSGHPPLSIRPWSSEEPTKKNVPYLLSRIIEQRGGIRNITEESLQEEIKNGDSQLEDSDSHSEKEQEEKSREEQVKTMRQDIVKFAK